MIEAIATAKEYGKALFLLAEEMGTTEKLREDILTAEGALKGNEDYVKLLNTPALSKDERLDIVDGAFSSLDPCLVNLIKILTEKRLAHLIMGAFEGFADLQFHSIHADTGCFRHTVAIDFPLDGA